ncbi:Endonuclease related to archaeal Holliday junction resolvase [Candidatus Tiddalikarchaeum anstoanum]|nr:Endonuclease related to archaeal Holliday junction resolvase [Candidatus Tiddalikarchaeum anstoanum]
MDTQALINLLKKSNFYAKCPCGEEFKMSDALLFDGTKPFPEKAKHVQEMLNSDLKEREEQLKKRMKLATEKVTKTTTAVNLGKELEKILPTLNDFKWMLEDCRFLADPIDFVVFNGLSMNKINSLSFVEVKSGEARLNKHQKCIKDAVEDGKVSYEVYK